MGQFTLMRLDCNDGSRVPQNYRVGPFASFDRCLRLALRVVGLALVFGAFRGLFKRFEERTKRLAFIDHPSLFGDVGRALERGDTEEAKRLFASHSDQLHKMTPLGTWLHYVAGQGSLEVAKYLVDRGLDVNAPDHRWGKLAIDSAASNGHVEMVRYLLDQGSRLDTSDEARNPLFAAVWGKSPEIAQLLLNRGIDASVRYGRGKSKPKSAVAFALWRGETAVARVIAEHLAGGNPDEADAILTRESQIAARQGALHPHRILPTAEDLQRK